MEPPPLSSRGRAAVEVHPLLDLDGSIAMVVVIKNRYTIAVPPSQGVTLRDDAEIRAAEIPWDPESKKTDSRYPCDVGLAKPSTDVLVVGSALALGAEPFTSLDLMVRAGPVQKAVRVFGTRVWYKSFVAIVPTPPEPTGSVAVQWANAFGGLDTTDPNKIAYEPRNPDGRGIAADPATLIHTPVPDIEDPDDLIRSHRSRPKPAGFAPIGAQYDPRPSYAGTMDQSWQDTRFPLRPADFDPRWFQVATPDLITPTPLRGGERVQILNMNQFGVIDFELPRHAWYVGGVIDGGRVEHRPMLDTVLIEPNDLKMEMTWRSVIRCPRPARRLSEVIVFEKERIE